MNRKFLFSIVISTRSMDENPELIVCLELLNRQAGIGEVEVVLVNDGGTYKDLRKDYPKINLKIINLDKNMGISFARNRGISESQGDIIIFLDDDSEPEDDWLEKTMTSWNENDEVDGITGIINYDSDDSLITRVHSDIVNWFIFLRKHNESLVYVWTGNGSFKKSVLDNMGGFDETFPKYGGEDTDLSLRIISSGGHLISDEKIVVKHAINLKLYSFLKKYLIYGIVSWRITKTFPLLRKTSIAQYIQLYRQSMSNKRFSEKIPVFLLISLSQAMTLTGLFITACKEIFSK